MNTYIKICLDNLIKNGYIHKKFIFQIVYSSPSISSVNINKLSSDIQTVNQKINALENEINDEAKNFNANAKLEELQKEINSSKENKKMEKDVKDEQKEKGDKNESKQR